MRFKNCLINNHEVYTVKDIGWNGVKNGHLLLLILRNSFEAWIVVDKSIPYQQNINNLPCLVIVLNVYRNTLKHLLPLVPGILNVLQQEQTSKVLIIEEKII